MRRVLREGRTTLGPTRQKSLGAVFLILALAGCTVIQGDTASLDNMNSASAAPVPLATPSTGPNDSLLTGSVGQTSIASSGIPIPLMSPRHRGVKIASIDPRSGLSAISLGVPIGQLAGVYVDFGKAMAYAEGSKLNSPKEVRRVLKKLRIEEPEMLADGWIAVRSMAAAQTAAFAKGVRDEVRYKGEARVLSLLEDPDYVLRLPGASVAVGAVMASGKAENERLEKLRKRLIETAFSFQKQKWGMSTPLKNGPLTQTAKAETGTGMVKKVLSAISPVSEAHAYSTTVMAKILARGARQSISAPILPISGHNDETTSCLNWARLNLNQCVAAAHFPSEEAWCTGTHAVEEVRACWAAALPATAR
jgi:hypothetical protein